MLLWKKAWGYKSLDITGVPAKVFNETQRIFAKNNLAGNKLRLNFSNIFGTQNMTFDNIFVSLSKDDVILKETTKQVKFNGNVGLILNPFSEVTCDEIDIEIIPGYDIAITTYFGETNLIECGFCTKSTDCVRVLNIEGDFTNDIYFEGKGQEKHMPITRLVKDSLFFYGLQSIDIYTKDSSKVICAFGDSIVNHGFWTGPLANFLYDKYKQQVSLYNMGISGNRVLSDGTQKGIITKAFGKYQGESGVRRFNKDAFAINEVDAVILFHGINDIILPYTQGLRNEKVTAREIIIGYLYYCEAAKNHNANIYCCTITPFKHHAFCFNEETENTRQEINNWIRNNNYYNGYFDFDKILRDEKDPQMLKENYHTGDNLHPNKTGGLMLANEIFNKINEIGFDNFFYNKTNLNQ